MDDLRPCSLARGPATADRAVPVCDLCCGRERQFRRFVATMKDCFGIDAFAVAERQAEEAAGEIATIWRRIAITLSVEPLSCDTGDPRLPGPNEQHSLTAETKRLRLLAKRWNEFRNRSAHVCLTIGTAMIGGSVVVLTSAVPRDGAYYWPVVGSILIGLSLILPFSIESEDL